MSLTRFNALESLSIREEVELDKYDLTHEPISSYYGELVFNDQAMKAYLDEDAYLKVRALVQSGSKLDRDLAGVIANAMKRWAMDKGVTHYAHWFQPLTGKTAEKHDSFFTLDKQGFPVEEFSASELAQQEPDGSSFPGGGLRSTFEARGYTAWDPTSPAFILETAEGRTLCIPTIFVTYSGDALDYKLPLLRSLHLLETHALEVCEYFDMKATKVSVTLGWEQEFFLIDEAFFNARPDLLMVGRTLTGNHPPKGQQLDDHYFGSIPERIYAYMRDLEMECHKLGIPVRTRHNEVGPGQYEIAPMFESVNIAIDHNQLLMDLMDRVARRHRLRVLLHEKPFAGVNGSGKHNNWSMATDTGVNLLSPGEQPGKNLRFLTFFVNTIYAVYKYADLLRASVASASNDYRLGGHEAPPAIISIFIGESLTRVLDGIEKGSDDLETELQVVLDLLSAVPDLRKDNTDRNRTSPFAFTGNKFEIRMVGSSQSCAPPMTIMNTIVGNQLKDFNAEVKHELAHGKSVQGAILHILKRYIKESKSIRFEGDGYSKEWSEEAKRRGLSITPKTPDALLAYTKPENRALFFETQVLTERELDAYVDVQLENYINIVSIEARSLKELVQAYIIPSAIKYQTELSQLCMNMKALDLTNDQMTFQRNLILEIQENISEMYVHIEEMKKHLLLIDETEDLQIKAELCAAGVCEDLLKIRIHADALERIMDDNEWPLVKYREMMFVR